MPHRARSRPGSSSTRFPPLGLLALAGILLPFNPASPLSSPDAVISMGAYLHSLPPQLYLFIKAILPWVPLGLLAGLGLRGRILHVLAPAATGLLLLSLPLLTAPRFDDLLYALYAFPGMALGIWLSQRMLPLASIHTPATEPENGGEVGQGQSMPATSSGKSHTRRRRHLPTPSAPAYSLPGMALGAVLLLGALLGAVDFSRWQAGLLAGLLLYGVVLWRYPLAWLVVVPAALPLLDLAPWSGRFFLDEFDLLMLVSGGVPLLRRFSARRFSGVSATTLLYVLWLAAAMIGVAIQLTPPPGIDANAFTSYWSPYNSLRVAKGFIWGGLFFLLLRRDAADLPAVARLLAIGMAIGLFGVSLVGLWERWLFVGFADTDKLYRIIATFSSMHTGGGHIEAYLVAALPFLWLASQRPRQLFWAAPLMLLVTAVLVYTVSRGGVLALGIVLAILVTGSLRLARHQGWISRAAPLAVLLLLTGALLAGIGGGHFQKRLAQVGEDWQIRVDHWTQALAMRDDTLAAQLFGMGLGSFPRVYLERGPADALPATYGFAREGDNRFLRLGSGATLYYAQRVAVEAGQPYRLGIDLRARQEGERIAVPLCEKQMLNSRNCVWNELQVTGDGQWHRHTLELNSERIGAGGAFRHPPVELFLYYPGRNGVIDVDNIRLLDAKGVDLLGNGGFTQGGDYWFFKTHSHLPWHIKNLWVQLLFEQGWAGLALFSSLTLLALTHLARAAWRGEALAWTLAASLAGLLTVGLFDSLLDTPRLATLLLAFMLLGGGLTWSRPRHISGA